MVIRFGGGLFVQLRVVRDLADDGVTDLIVRGAPGGAAGPSVVALPKIGVGDDLAGRTVAEIHVHDDV